MIDKFKNCFTSKLPNYRYDIEIDGEKIASAHLLNAKDQAYIEQNSVTKELRNGNYVIDICSQDHITYTLFKALDEWVLDEPLSVKAIEDLLPSLRAEIYAAIQDHESQQAQIVEDTEKN